MTNNMLHNINRNKANLNTLEEQYSSGKKIQRPSDDPVVAIRSLKLRTNLTELNQYYKKNIPDAKSWMDVTEGALNTVNDILTSMHTYQVQGASDTLTKADRETIVANLKELAQQIYQEGNSDYAGRYVFTGYKTDTSLVFPKEEKNLHYTITEEFKGSDIEAITKVKVDSEFDTYDLQNLDVNDINSITETINTYRLQLSYDNLVPVDADGNIPLKLDPDGMAQIKTVSLSDEDAYNPGADQIQFIPETGELILGEGAYNGMRNLQDIKITYEKNSFEEGDLRPEHYFNCTAVNQKDPDKVINYTLANQQIQYEVNFNQKLTINTQAKDAITSAIGRGIDDIINAIEDVETTENKIQQVKKAMEDPNVANKEGLEKLLGNLNEELILKNQILQDTFEKGMTITSKQQDVVNVAIADLGSRYVRLELTESRLATQQVDFEELLSENEDVDLVETVIKYNSAETIYNASLSAASQVVRSTLLDFL